MNKVTTPLGVLAVVLLVLGLASWFAARSGPPEQVVGAAPPDHYLTVVSGFGAIDRAWLDDQYVPLPDALGLSPCGVPAWPTTAGDLELGPGCTLTEGAGPPCAEVTGVRGTVDGWAVDVASVRPGPGSTMVEGALHTPRGDGVTLVGDGERWCATPWGIRAQPAEVPDGATTVVDLVRVRRATRGGVVILWRGASRPL